MPQPAVTDVIRIENLFARYIHGLDHKSRDEFMSCFWEDATLVSPLMDGPSEGQSAIAEFYDKLRGEPNTEGTESGKQHWTANVIYDQNDDGSVDAWCHFLFLTGANVAGPASLTSYGEYQDTLVRRDDEWRFQRREITILAAA